MALRAQPPFSGWSTRLSNTDPGGTFVLAVTDGLLSFTCESEDNGSRHDFQDVASDPNIFTLDDAGTLSDVDTIIRWRCLDEGVVEGTSGFGIAAHVRLGASAEPGYSVRAHVKSDGDTALSAFGANSYDGGTVETDNVIAETTLAHNSFTYGLHHWLRVRVTEEGTGTRVRAKSWPASMSEPSAWQIDALQESGDASGRYKGTAGYFGISNAGSYDISYGSNQVQGYITRTYEIAAVGMRRDRVRSGVSLTVGDILQEVASPQFELSGREAFFESVDLVEGVLHLFAESIAPNVVTHQWFPLPVSTEPGLVEYAASTKLGRMTRAYPEPFVARAIDLVGTDTMTAQQVLEQLFNRWATEFDWFTYKTVPDLRHRVASADAPSDYTDGVGELTLPAIVMRQEEPNRRTMRQILDRVLSLFPGTALVQDADGDIALRPTYGPDAPTAPDVTLSTDDIASISDGVPDTQRIYNLARVTSDGGDFEPDTALTTSLYGLIAFGDEPEAALGPDGENVLPTAREEIDVNAWHAFDTLAAGDTVDVEYTIRMYALYYGSDPSMANPPSDVTLETTATATITLTLGAGETVIRVSDLVGEFLGGGGIDAYADIAFEADRSSGIYVGYKDFTPYGAVRHFSGTSWFRFAWVVEVDTTGLGYVEAPETVIGKFGYDLTTDEILATDGTSNALAVSQATYGERELQLSSDLFPLTLDQALRIAEGAVLHYINPRTIYQVEQAWWNAFPVKPDHIGRIAELPTTEQGFVQARSYADSFEDPDAPLVASTFELVLTEAAFTTAGLLAFDDGELWSFDDGSLRKADE